MNPIPAALPGALPKNLGELARLTEIRHWRNTKAARSSILTARLVVSAIGADSSIESIDRPTIANCVGMWEWQGNKPGTVNRKLSALSTMLRVARDCGIIDEVPSIRWKREDATRITWLSREDEADVLGTASYLSKDLKQFMTLAIDTGMRRGELLRATPGDIRGESIVIPVAKSGRPRAVPLTVRSLDVVEARIKARPKCKTLFEGYSEYDLRAEWERLREIKGHRDNPEWTIHMLRHTCASRLLESGVGLIEVKEWLGHANIATTMRYAHLRADALVGALNKLERSNSNGTVATQA